MSVTILDYGMGNLRSVQKAFERVGCEAIVTAEAEIALKASKLVLPGVGAFGDAITRLQESGLDNVIIRHVRSGKPFLGICLGLQLLFTRSFEEGEHEGLNLLAGQVVRFPRLPALKVPHMGWNTLRLIQPECPLFCGLPDNVAVYFVHSYYAQPEDHGVIAAEADYPNPFTAAVWKDNIFATQFHPEKSQQVGLRMLKNFAGLAS